MGLRAEGAGLAPGAAGRGGSWVERKGWSTAPAAVDVLLALISPFFPHFSPAEKPGLTERKGGLGVPSRDRNVGASGQDSPGVSLQPVSGDSPDREPGGSPGLQSSPQLPHMSPCSWAPVPILEPPFPQFTPSLAFLPGSDLCPGDVSHILGLHFPSAP